MANNVADLGEVSGSGQGVEISMEQLALWNPELILFAEGSIYDTVGDDAAFADLDARQEQRLLRGAHHAVELAQQPADGEPGAGHAVAAAPSVPRSVR